VKNKFDNEINSNNLRYLNELGIFNYSDGDKLFGYSKGYFWKVASTSKKYPQSLTKAQAIALEYKLGIPEEIFFNPDVKTIEHIHSILLQHKKKKYFTIPNNFEHVIDALSEYKYFYIYDKSAKNKIIIREFEIIGTNINIYVGIDNKRKLRSSGFIYVSTANIIIISENIVTGNNMILKIPRSNLIGEAFPVNYMGHSAIDYREISGYGVCTKAKISSNKVAINLVSIENFKNKSYLERRESILSNLKDFIKNLH